MRLAVVVITKNQDWNIARLIESILSEIQSLKTEITSEVVVVDSASTDATVETACQYDVDVIRLSSGQRLNAAIGRQVGYDHTEGDAILFLDGDMELCKGWLAGALKVLQGQPDIAVVSGQLIDLPKATKPSDPQRLEPLPSSDAFTEILQGGGAALYRRSVLREVGSFNPHLYSEEEPELCLRIRHAGYRIIRLEQPIAYHYSDPAGQLSTHLGRWRRNLYLGGGQNMRRHWGGALLWPYVKERGFGCLPALGLLLGFLSLLGSLSSGQWLWFGLWLGALVTFVVVSAYRKRSLYDVTASLLDRALWIDGTVRGFLLPPGAADDSSELGPDLEVVSRSRSGDPALDTLEQK